jgi:hypothetical protein
LDVQSSARTAIVVTCDNPSVKVVVSSPERAADQGYYYETRVVLDVAPQALKQGFKATLTVKSVKNPSVVLKVPIEVVDSIEVAETPLDAFLREIAQPTDISQPVAPSAAPMS